MMGFMILSIPKYSKIDHPYGGGEFTEVLEKTLRNYSKVAGKVQYSSQLVLGMGFNWIYSWFCEFTAGSASLQLGGWKSRKGV
jgi:hypothetical protein